MSTAASCGPIGIVIAFGLDLLVGDPRSWPHPVRWIGALAAAVEGECRRRLGAGIGAGAVAVAVVLGVVAGVTALSLSLAAAFSPWAASAVGVYLLYTAIAVRDLAVHGQRVHRALAAGDLAAARRAVAMIVGRETAHLDAAGVARACVESVAENIVDGVTAPLFWGALLGPVGAVAYKAVNTMDSMFGYKNERYLLFGRVAARVDDAANWLPARLTALAVVAAAALLPGMDAAVAWRIWRRDHGNHASPNSGHSEAAVAGALGVRLGGESRYFGRPVVKPTIGEAREPIGAGHIIAATRLLYVTSILGVTAAALMAAVLH